MTIAAIHSQLGNMNVVRKWHRLDRPIAHLGVFWRRVVPRRRSQSTDDYDATNYEFDRQPIRPAWKEIRHDSKCRWTKAKIENRQSGPDRKSTIANRKLKIQKCFVQTLQKVKVNRSSEGVPVMLRVARQAGNEDSMNARQEGKINFVIRQIQRSKCDI